jgi:hypothetical protein
MVLTIGSDVITSDRTVHPARRLPRDFTWREVSYLPGRRMDQEDAVTAMKLADEAGREYSPDLFVSPTASSQTRGGAEVLVQAVP